MADQRRKLLEVLAEIRFSERYYRQYEAWRDRKSSAAALSQADLQAALDSTGLAFRYYKSEKFFSYREKERGMELGLNVKLEHSNAEFILVFKPGDKHLGGPFPLLARMVEHLRNPDFTYNPPSPKLPFSNFDELRETVQFGVDLYQDIKKAVLAVPDWNQ